MAPILSPTSFGRWIEGGNRLASGISRKLSSPQPPAEPTATVLVGPKQQRFKVNKRLLCASASFFAERLDDPSQSRSISLWLPRESVSMFALFVQWVHLGLGFRQHLDDAVNNAHESSDQAIRDLHWSMIRLHLFASRLGMYRLQDLVMDAIQDLYLRCDWDVPPSLITFLYTDCEDLAAIRLRRWAVAMVAFSLTGGPRVTFNPQDSAVSESERLGELLEELPEFATDYDIHMEKMRQSGLDIRFKNPQLRIPANRLRNEERAFGFRQCSFHSHRSSAGERRCPHEGPSKRYRSQPSTPGLAVDNAGLSAPSRKNRDMVPRPLFSDRTKDDDTETDEDAVKAIKHVRSISSIVKR